MTEAAGTVKRHPIVLINRGRRSGSRHEPHPRFGGAGPCHLHLIDPVLKREPKRLDRGANLGWPHTLAQADEPSGGALVDRLSRPGDLDREAVELSQVLRRQRLCADLRRVEHLIATDTWMSATRQLGNRLAYEQLFTT